MACVSGAIAEAVDVAAVAQDAGAELGVAGGEQAVGDARRVALVEDVVADDAVGQRQQPFAVRNQGAVGGMGRILAAVAGECAAGGAKGVGAVERQAGAQPGYAGGGGAAAQAVDDRRGALGQRAAQPAS